MGFLAPVIGAIGSFVGGLGFVGKAVLGIGMNLIASKIAKNQAKKQAASASGVQFERAYGENVSRQVACGYVGLAGHDCYVNTYNDANRDMQQVFLLSDFPCDGLSRIWAGGTLLNIELLPAESDAVVQRYRVADGDYAGLISFAFYSGAQTGADPALVEHANPSGRWTQDHVGSGLCYLIVSLAYDQERLSAFPDFFFEIRGARLYDPRKDATIGGSGTHRFGQYETYEFSENPIVMEYNYRRGFAWGGDLFLGMDMDDVDLPIDKYVVAMNICDEVAGGEARYRCSIFLDADLDHGDNIDALMTSCGGMVIDSVDGSWPLIGTQQPIIETFTDDDLVPGEALTFQRRSSMSDLVNSVGGTYPEPSNMWSPASYDTQTSASYVGIDRRTRDFQLNLDCVPSKRQANQLAAIYFNENRYEATAEIVLPPRYQTIQAGDWVRWISAGYGDRVYIVQSRTVRALTENGPRNVALSLRERDGAIYASAGVIAGTIPFPNGEPVYLNELQDWQVIPVLATAGDGRTYPAFRLSWSPIEDVTVQAIDFQYWFKAEPGNVFSRRIGSDVTIGFIQEGIIGEEIFVFRHKLAADRVTLWSDEVEVMSLDGGNGDLEVYLANLNKEVLDQFGKLFAELDDVRPILERLLTNEQLSGATTEIMGRSLAREVDNAKALFSEEISVVTGGLAAAVTQVTTLQTDYLGNKAQVQSSLATVSSNVSALAQIAQQLTSTVAENSAQGLVKFVVAANQAGVDARFSVAIRGNVGQAFKETGFYLELYNGGFSSRFAVLADQFVVTNGVNGTLPLVFENGELKLQIANIGTVTTGLLQGNNGKLIINLNAGYMAVYD